MAEDDQKAKSAEEWQGGDKYAGIDEYERVTLKAGTKLYALVINPEKDTPEYFFPPETMREVGGDSRKLNEGLQIAPYKHRHTLNIKEYASYRNKVAVYELKEDLTVQTGITNANSQYGKGGIRQYYIPSNDFGKLSRVEGNKSLIELGNNYITKKQYEDIKHKVDHVLVRRNLFCLQRAKLVAMDVIRNSPSSLDVEKARTYLKKLNGGIRELLEEKKNLTIRYGSAPISKYSHLNEVLSNQIKYREEHPEVIFFQNVKTFSEGKTAFDEICTRIVEEHEAERVSDNLNSKIIGYQEYDDFRNNKMRSNPIEIVEQGLVDVRNIVRNCENVMKRELKPTDFSGIQTIAFQREDGKIAEIKLSQILTDKSIEEIRKAKNGHLTGLLEMMDGKKAKMILRDGTGELYMARSEKQLREYVEGMSSISEEAKKHLLNGGSVVVNNRMLRIDKELNAVVPIPYNPTNNPPFVKVQKMSVKEQSENEHMEAQSQTRRKPLNYEEAPSKTHKHKRGPRL